MFFPNESYRLWGLFELPDKMNHKRFRKNIPDGIYQKKKKYRCSHCLVFIDFQKYVSDCKEKILFNNSKEINKKVFLNQRLRCMKKMHFLRF